MVGSNDVWPPGRRLTLRHTPVRASDDPAELGTQDVVILAVKAQSVRGVRQSTHGLALATRFEPSVFWSEVQVYGATVVFYAGEMARELKEVTSQARHALLGPSFTDLQGS